VKHFRPLVLSLALMAAAPAAIAGTTTSFGFACYTNNTGSCSSFTSQFSLTVEETSATEVKFTFANSGPTGFITNIYFDTNIAGSLRLSSLSIPGGQTGVNYSIDSTPGNARPPGSNSGAFSWANGTTDFTANPAAPGPTNGVNAGEQLVINGLLGAGVSYADLVASFGNPNTASRIGMHVQGLGPNAQSEGMYAVPETAVVPVPGALPLMLGGLFGIGYLARRRKG